MGALAAAAAAIAFAAVGVLPSLHLTFNRTPSVPVGFYRTFPVDRAPRRGDLVEICLPDALAAFASQRNYVPPGPCSAKTAPLLKYVAAVDGDRVDLDAAGVHVNGRILPGSRVLSRDEAGRGITHIRFTRYALHGDEVWLATTAPNGWDSRYYGALPVRNIRAYAQAFVTW